jgi:hypothetical protein
LKKVIVGFSAGAAAGAGAAGVGAAGGGVCAAVDPVRSNTNDVASAEDLANAVRLFVTIALTSMGWQLRCARRLPPG